MPPRLSTVVSKLYRPPANGEPRQVFALSRSDAERVPRLPSIAVISITAPDRPAAELDGFDYLLRISFADVDFLDPERSRRAKAKLANFTPEHAELVCTFIDSLPVAVSTIVVHCEGGYSRSCAIARGLHEFYGYAVDMRHLENANPSVLHVFMQTAKAWVPFI